MSRWVRLLCAAFVLAGATNAGAALTQRTLAPAVDPVMLVVDVSGSMGDDDGSGTRKIDGAKLALLDYVGNVQQGAPIGLRTYPDQGSGDCNSGKLDIPVGPVDPLDMSAAIRRLSPDGDTPTAEAMRAAVRDLKSSGASHGTLVVVSDGLANCADPCPVAKQIAGQGFDLDALTVGFRISDEGRKQLQCIASALGGRYLDIKKSQDLRNTLDRLGRPKLRVALDPPATHDAVAGGDYVDVGATITNDGEVAATDAIGQITFGSTGASSPASDVDVRIPVRRLGNLEPHGSERVVWRARASTFAAGRTIPFTITGRSLNASEDGQATGVLHVSAGGIGPALKGPGKDIAILGDSYSSGEGADVYLPGTDEDQDGCHKSPLTYLVPEAGPNVRVIACSGALTANIDGPNTDNHEPPQVQQLAKLQNEGPDARPARAVVMTIGGNDAKFGDLVKSCLTARESCTRRVYSSAPWNFLFSSRTGEFEDRVFGSDSDLPSNLGLAYAAVNDALNAPAVVARRRAVAPILVLGYALAVPLQGRACAPMGVFTHSVSTEFGIGTGLKTEYLLTAGEIDFLASYAARLNGVIEAAVDTARERDGIPVFFVPTTEAVMQTTHTVCDIGKKGSPTEPFARSVISVNGAGISAADIVALVDPAAGPRLKWKSFKGVAGRALNEIAHPNARGYEAITRGIFQWSESRAGGGVEDFLKKAHAAEPAPTSWKTSGVDLGQLAQGATPTLQGGTSYRLTVDGFEPNTRVDATLHTRARLLATLEADANGRIATLIPIPRHLASGSHALVLTGAGRNGHPRVVSIHFEIAGGWIPAMPWPIAIVAGLLFALGIALAVFSRRVVRSAPFSPSGA